MLGARLQILPLMETLTNLLKSLPYIPLKQQQFDCNFNKSFETFILKMAFGNWFESQFWIAKIFSHYKHTHPIIMETEKKRGKRKNIEEVIICTYLM